MNKSALSILLAIVIVSCSTPPADQKKAAVEGPYEQKIDSLIALMTIEEKVGQLNLYNGPWDFTGPVPEGDAGPEKYENIKKGLVGGMLNVVSAKATREAQRIAVEDSRLKIPLIFGYDVVHGYKTMFPVPLAQASSWSFEGAKLGAQIAAKEAAAAGLNWTFAPMIDISRDGRWGRIMEGAGEDPYLTSIMAVAWVEGFQGEDLSDPLTIAACAKHFAAYGFAEGGRDYNTVDISNQTLHNIVLPPFKAAVDAGVATVMNSFNEIAGVPATGSEYLQRTILKDGWDFKGFVVSDWGSLGELITHGYAADTTQAAEISINAGSDMDMEARVYEYKLADLIASGAVDVAKVDDAVRRILRVKFQLGLFDDPYRYSDETREKENTMTADNLAAARMVGKKSIVLLKNNDRVLPLSKEVKSIAVIGSLAESKDVPLGSWRAQAIENSAVSVLEGIKAAVSENTKVTFEAGYKLTEGRRTFIHELTFVKDDKSGFAKAIAAAKSHEAVVLVVGEDCFQTGEGRSQTDISLKGSQLDLFKQIIAVNPNVVVVLQNGRPLAIPEIMQQSKAVVEGWFLGQEAGNAIADVLFGDYNPSGKLPVSFPYVTGQEPLYYNIKNTGRPITNDHDDGLVFWSHYTDNTKEALIPFGYGLSYTTFSYENVDVSSNGNKEVTVKFTLTNTGDRAGIETAQVYIRDIAASITQPVKRLVDFKQVQLEAGQSQELTFTLTEEDLGFWHNDGSFHAEPGEFMVMVGSNSVEVTTKNITLK